MTSGRTCTQRDTLRQPLLQQEQGEYAQSSPDVLQQDQPPPYDEGLARDTTSSTPPDPRDRTILPSASGESEIELRHRRRDRILDRDAAFFQSRGRWSVRHVSRGQARLLHTPEGASRRQAVTKQFWNDWFHTLAYQKTFLLMLILFLIYTAIVFIFGFIYLFVSLSGQTSEVDPNDGSTHTRMFCDMDIHDHMEALYFSLSTMTTIGYGVSDYYFGGCWTPLLLVLAQVCCAITFDAVAIGLLFQRISRGHKRSKSILFSDKATIRRVRGVPYLYIRLAELRHHQLLEATVRAYCVRHERHREVGDGVVETTHFVTKPMKLLHESVGSHIIMSLPQVIVHRMDHESPLVPTEPWCDINGQRRGGISAGEVNLPQNYNRKAPEQGKDQLFVREMKDIKSFLQDREAEIVILLEGIDELTGAVTQTRHSYTCEELAWNERFAPCTYPYSEYLANETDRERRCGRRLRRDPPLCVVDFAHFHETVPAPLDSYSCPYVSLKD